MAFTREQLEGFRDSEVADFVGGRRPLIAFVGINPGLWTAATQTHFAHPSNRFYEALYRAGITDRPIDPTRGLSEDDRVHLLDRGMAITNIVARATAKAAELTAAELRAGARDLEQRLRSWRPKVVAVAGVTAYRQAFGRRSARLGRQPETLAGAELWVVPNPSGLNAHHTVDSLAEAYREAALAAGAVARS